jgi:hypothetical protein
MNKTTFLISSMILFGFFSFHTLSQEPGRKLIIHLRGVYDANIEVLRLQKKKYDFLPNVSRSGVKGGSTVTLGIPAKELPGQFTVQFKYRLKESDYPYPAQRTLFIGNQDVEIWISPIYGNNPDSTWFAKGETENNTYEAFMNENSKRRGKVNLLQMLLLQYDDTDSELYRVAQHEYDKRRNEYNNWVTAMTQKHSELFVGRLFQFQYIPAFSFTGTEKERTQSLIDHYFEGINLNDELLAGTRDFNDWLTMYVNLNNDMYTDKAQADTMLVKAARRLVEHARQTASPKVYGFVVDYFYTGFETYDMPEGVKMLDAYAQDPRCLTTKRLEIQRRLAGLEALKIDAPAPEIAVKDTTGNDFSLHGYRGKTSRKLLLFWSADCAHCMQLVQELKTWCDNHPAMIDVIAMSLDQTDTEVAKWNENIKQLTGWVHLRAPEGINSKVAYDYAVLATPYMYLISATKNTIIGIPDDIPQLNAMVINPY